MEEHEGINWGDLLGCFHGVGREGVLTCIIVTISGLVMANLSMFSILQTV